MNEIDRPVATGAADAHAAWPFPRRLVAVFTSPRSLFEHLEYRPTWFVPFLLLLLSAAAFVVFTWDSAWAPMMTAKLDEQGAPDQAYEMITGNGKMMYSIIIPFFGGLVTVLYAAIVMGAGSFMLGGRLSFRQALSIVSHAGLVGLVAVPIRVLTANLAQNPQVTLGPGALLPLADQEGFAMKFLAGFLQAFDVFSIWQTVLVALGVSVIARVAYRASLITMFALFVVFSIIGALLGAFTG